jgi:hypothetical protein
MISRTLFRGLVLPMMLAGGLVILGQSSATEGKRVEVVNGVSVTVTAPWFLANRTKNAIEIAYPRSRVTARVELSPGIKPETVDDLVTADARLVVQVEPWPNHEQALSRLAQLAVERVENADLKVVAGWPSMTRTWRAPLPRPGEGFEQMQSDANDLAQYSSTSVAAGNLMIRFSAVLAPGASAKLLTDIATIVQTVQAAGGNATTARQELDRVSKTMASKRAVSVAAPKSSIRKPRGVLRQVGSALVQTGVGELEIAASSNGQNVVVAANSGFSYSVNGGQTFTFGGGTPCIYNGCDGDPSLAVGQSGNFYYSWIGDPQTGGSHAAGWTDSLSSSTTGGQSFGFVSDAVFCPATTPAVCTVPDQPHIAADRWTASSSSQDRVYLVWRNFSSVSLTPEIVCSSSSGATWSTATIIDADADFPRLTVGPDGFVYVAYVNGSHTNIMLQKFGTCDSGLNSQPGFPVAVSAYTDVVCPVPGLDRCNDGNVLSSPTAAVDDLNASHVYVAWATSSGAGNENIMVADSMNGGSSFPRTAQVNSAVTARRFMPWLAVYGGVAQVNWYDRRTGTAANNDLTRYYSGSAAVIGGNLVAGTETDISQVDDHQCSVWPCAPRSTLDSESCSVQPQLAGICSVSRNRCDFSSGGCLSPQTCNTSGGCPKYGDYNGAAAMAGSLYTAWTSTVPPPGVTGSGSGLNVYEATNLLPSDFYVRDWTSNPTQYDLGPEPSTPPGGNFWSTSDVWNQNNSAAYSPVNGWILGDGGVRSGSNFAFARVSRRAPAAPTASSTTVTVTFLAADYGLGNPFATIGTETVTFAAGDNIQITPPLPWNVAATASTHVCLAVEISAPGNPYLPPSLAGGSPGPSGTDPLILQDNKKAQRNLQATSGTGTPGVEGFAMIHNIEKISRDVVLRYSVGPRATAKDVRGGTLRVVGGISQPLAVSGRLVLTKMAPGESRWVGVRFGQLTRAEGSRLEVDFSEVSSGRGVNGFALAISRASEAAVAARVLANEQDVLARLAAISSDAEPKRLSATVSQLAGELAQGFDTKRYSDFMVQHSADLSKVVQPQISRETSAERFGLNEALRQIKAALDAHRADALLVAQDALIQRLDAYLNALQASTPRK